ncbi:streptococcal histidine triad protein PhpA [Streptococcus pneumoniae]|nr:streptococcal histidine triad protein PhpA [Streptococcus pneumoniae]
MVLDYFFDKNLVFCLEADNQEQLFDQVASLLEEREIVTPTYREALITREKSFPTGLDMEFLGKDLPNVAIPHTDIVLLATVKYYVEHPNERPHSDNGFGNASDHVQRNKNGQADTNQTEKPSEEKPQTEKPEEETPREEKPQSEKPESPKPTEEPEEESPEESEEPQVETEKVEEKLREAEDLLGKIQDPIIKSNAKETLTGLKNNLLFGTQDNNTIMAEAEKLLALLKESK